MRRQGLTGILAGVVLVSLTGGTAGRAGAQAPAPAPGGASRETIAADFEKDLKAIERTRLKRLAGLAAAQPRAEADKTYEELFRLTVATGLYVDVEPTAEAVIAKNASAMEVRFLAEVVNMIAEASRGAYEDSLKSLEAASNESKEATRAALPVPTRLSIIDLYYQKLVQAGQFEIAARAFQKLDARATNPLIKEVVANRLQRLSLIGKPAPAIVGKDIDGKPFDLAANTGKVTLVVFWATWCVPSSDEARRLDAFYERYRDKGFRIVGINVDALQEGVDVTAALPNIRRFLVDHDVRWPVLVNLPGAGDLTRPYAVSDLPSSALVGKDGTVVQIDVTRGSLTTALEKALAK